MENTKRAPLLFSQPYSMPLTDLGKRYAAHPSELILSLKKAATSQPQP